VTRDDDYDDDNSSSSNHSNHNNNIVVVVVVVIVVITGFPATVLTDNTQRQYKLYCIFLLACKLSMAFKAMRK
jgi:heme/copper-type cytochrome/quinol oxidase subunit 4